MENSKLVKKEMSCKSLLHKYFSLETLGSNFLCSLQVKIIGAWPARVSVCGGQRKRLTATRQGLERIWSRPTGGLFSQLWHPCEMDGFFFLSLKSASSIIKTNPGNSLTVPPVFLHVNDAQFCVAPVKLMENPLGKAKQPLN